MNVAYIFRVGVLCFILNVQQSKIGYAYPRIFVRFPDDSYLNCDLSIGALFKMTAKDWDSWIDGTEIHLDAIEEVRAKCSEAGINWDEFEKIAFEWYEDALAKTEE